MKPIALPPGVELTPSLEAWAMSRGERALRAGGKPMMAARMALRDRAATFLALAEKVKPARGGRDA